MPLGQSLLRTVNNLLTKFDATDRPVYKRVITTTGGDALLGRPGTTTYKDTLLNPQPAVDVVTDQMLAMGVISSGQVQIGDYKLLLSASALTRSDLQSKATVLLFKDSSGAVEELMIVSFAPLAVTGIDVAFEVLARSKQRPS